MMGEDVDSYTHLAEWSVRSETLLGDGRDSSSQRLHRTEPALVRVVVDCRPSLPVFLVIHVQCGGVGL